MNTARVWILRAVAIGAIAFGASLLYEAYQDFGWYRLAMSEAGEPGPLDRRSERIMDESNVKNMEGVTAENSGLLFLCAGLALDGLASVLRKVEVKP